MIRRWRQILHEVGAEAPDRNVERLIRDTQVRTDPSNQCRMGLIATGFDIYDGLALFTQGLVVLEGLSCSRACRPSVEGGPAAGSFIF